jgi:hypothetical protein
MLFEYPSEHLLINMFYLVFPEEFIQFLVDIQLDT